MDAFCGVAGIGKKGGVMDEEIVKVILAVVVFAAMAWLLVNLFSPVFDEGDETAKSYFDMLERSVDEVDGLGSASFFMLDNGRDDMNFYLAYFGNLASFKRNDKIFTRKLDSKENVLCVCSESGKSVVCKYCRGMDLPVSFFYNDVSQQGGGTWTAGGGRKVKLEKEVANYAFSS